MSGGTAKQGARAFDAIQTGVEEIRANRERYGVEYGVQFSDPSHMPLLPVDASSDVMLRVAALPEPLWRGPCIFQFL